MTASWKQRVDKAWEQIALHSSEPRSRPPRVVVERALRQLFADIAEEAIHGGHPRVPDFGIFLRRTRAARQIRDMKTGSMRQLPQQVSLGFRCSKSIKR